MTGTEVKVNDLIEQVGELKGMVGDLKDSIDQLNASVEEGTLAVLAHPSIEPPPAESVWDGFDVNAPLAPYKQGDGGWVSPDGPQGYFDEKKFFKLGTAGVSPDGRVLHGGDAKNGVAAKSEGLLLKALAENADSNLYAGTQWGRANIPPTVATVLMCLRCVSVEHARQFGLSSAGLVPAEYENVTSLQALYDLLVARSQGTGSVSGDPIATQ